MLSTLRTPVNARWLLTGTLITMIGNGMQTLAVGKLLYDATGSAAAFGGVLIFEQVLSFLLNIVAGPWIDRGDPRRTSALVELFRGTAVCLASVGLGLSTATVPWIILMTLAIRVVHPFYRSATFALGPGVIPPEDLERFNGYSNLCQQGGQLIGVALAAPVIAYLGAPVAFFINGVSFLLSAVTIALVNAPAIERTAAPAATAAWRQLVTGWAEIGAMLRRDVGLACHLVLGVADAVAVNLFNLILVPLVAHRYAGSAYWLSIVDGAFATGAMASAFLVAPLSRRFGQLGATIVGIGGQALAFGLLAVVADQWSTVLFAFAIGAANTVSWTVLMTALQLRAKGLVKGRISTVRSSLTAAATGMLVPLVARAETVSLTAALTASAGVCLAFTLMAVVLGPSRRLGTGLLGDKSPLNLQPTSIQ